MTQRYGNGPRRPREPADTVSDWIDQFGRGSRHLGPIVLVLLAASLLFTASFQVEPGEIAVIRTLGKETGRVEPGFHWLIPGIQQYDRVNIARVHRIEVGFRGNQLRAEEAQMLTGDENIVDAQMIVQYRVSNPSKYLFQLHDVEGTLRSTAEVALRSIIGQTSTDDAITKGRGSVQTKTRELLQRLMDTYNSGIQVSEVKLQNVDPPEEVKDAFHEVVRAREEREKLINQAEGYREEVIPKAKGEAERQLRDAEGYREQRVLRAQGDANRFNSIYAEYSKSKEVTQRRMYIETMERVLGKMPNKTILDDSVTGSTLPFLPLGKSPIDLTNQGASK
jgi:modulator of FtsH protease HflK